MQKHIQLLGIIYIAYHSIGLVFASVVWGILSGIGFMSGDPQAAGILALVGTFVAGLLLSLSVPGIVGGVGILKGWWWSRYLVLVLGVFNLVRVPLGTILGVYTLLGADAERVDRLLRARWRCCGERTAAGCRGLAPYCARAKPSGLIAARLRRSSG